MARDRLTALRAQQEIVGRDSTNGASWPYYPPGLTNTLTRVPPYQIPVSIPQTPSPVACVQFNKNKTGDWTYPNPATKVPHFKQHPSPPYPLILKDLSQKPIRLTLEDDMTRFYGEIATIQEKLKNYNDNISRISQAHSRSLDSMDWVTARRGTLEIQTLMGETRKLGSDLRLRIKNLHVSRKGENGREAQIRKQQAALVKFKFIEAIQNYQQMEQRYRHRYRQRLEKQIKIVNPEATPEEVRAAIDNQDNDQVFSQMLKGCNKLGESRAVFNEVQERHDDIQKIERTLFDLTQLLNDMNLLVFTQDKVIDEIEVITDDVEVCAKTGYTEMGKALNSARAHRKRKWICIALAFVLVILFTISITILIVATTNGNL